MTRNMSTIDRAVRAFLVAPAAFVAALAVGIGSIGGILLVVVAAIMVGTAAAGYCPLYALLGIRTGGRHRPARA
jgi:hypothetical protein